MLRLIALAVIGVAVAGCSAEPSPVEQFKADQEGIVTSHGPVEMSTVRESPNGAIAYSTADGQTWEVSREVKPDGSRQYGKPVPLRAK